MFWQLVVLCSLTLSEATPIERAVSCREMSIPVTISTQIKQLPSELTHELLNNDHQSFFDLGGAASAAKIMTNSYNVSARYCAPTVSIGTRSTTLQFLVHGLTYTKDYWSDLAAPKTDTTQDQYSWIAYATSEGYPTLSIDRPCNGDSSHPNGVLNCQFGLNTEVMHAVTQLARSGKLPIITTSFSKVIFVGHSYGSLIGADLSVKHSADIDAYILSGYSRALTISVAILPVFIPAALAVPSRFGSLTADPSYLALTRQAGARQSFYYGQYDESIFQYDFDHRGTLTIGEIATLPLSGPSKASDFRGALFVLNGNEDLIFCSRDAASAVLNVTANCDNGFSTAVQADYPAAAYSASTIPEIQGIASMSIALHKNPSKQLMIFWPQLGSESTSKVQACQL